MLARLLVAFVLSTGPELNKHSLALAHDIPANLLYVIGRSNSLSLNIKYQYQHSLLHDLTQRTVSVTPLGSNQHSLSSLDIFNVR